MPSFDSEIVARRQAVREQAHADRPAPIVVDVREALRVAEVLGELDRLVEVARTAGQFAGLPGIVPMRMQEAAERLVELQTLLGLRGGDARR